MLLHFVLELLCSVILATDTTWHSASLNLGSAESRHFRGGESRKGDFWSMFGCRGDSAGLTP